MVWPARRTKYVAVAGAGGILMSGSAAGNSPIPNNAAIKAFINTFSKSLRGELHGSGTARRGSSTPAVHDGEAKRYRLMPMCEQQFDAIVVGAGFGGIGAVIQLNRLGYDNILAVGREDNLGGTWHVNHYPGLSVDQPSPTFSGRTSG